MEIIKNKHNGKYQILSRFFMGEDCAYNKPIKCIYNILCNSAIEKGIHIRIGPL